jgi:hypothetical protein
MDEYSILWSIQYRTDSHDGTPMVALQGIYVSTLYASFLSGSILFPTQPPW